jgi:hypothetical protein
LSGLQDSSDDRHGVIRSSGLKCRARMMFGIGHFPIILARDASILIL